MTIPFVKAHGARNDFLLTWRELAPTARLREIAVAICDRNAGIGADGWMVVDRTAPSIHLYNSDGSEAEISGNGTRCAAALLIDAGIGGSEISISTGAGKKHLKLIGRDGKRFQFEMDMGVPEVEELEATMAGFPATILHVGNPQCALIVDEFPENWRTIGAELERHPRFPKRTNVSFVKIVDRYTIETRFFERGAGATMSSGTGSTGAAAAAILRGLTASTVTVLTEAGPLALRWSDSLFLTGPAEITAQGEFFYDPPPVLR